MSKQSKTLGRTVLLTVVFAGLSGMARAMTLPDRIEQHSGPDIRSIKISKAGIDFVAYTRFTGEGAAKQIAASKVKEISWGDAGEFRRAISYSKQGKWDLALRSLARKPPAPPRDFWYGPYSRVLHGRCLLETGKHAKALVQFNEVTKKYPKSFYVLGAIHGKARAYLELEQLDEAAKAYTELARHGRLWALRAHARMAEIYVRMPGKAAEAERLYDKLVKEAEAVLASPPPELKKAVAEVDGIHQRALVGKAEVLMSLGKLDGARQWIDSISNKVTDKEARTKLYLALGDLSTRAARKLPDAQARKVHYKKALLSYMRIYILCPDQKAGRRRAMLGAAMASEFLGSPADRRRAIKLYKELRSEFRGTSEAGDAKKRLEALGVKVDNK